MGVTARDIMEKEFVTVRPDTPILEAVKVFGEASRKLERRVFGMMVTDAAGRLIGMISMYDILLMMRPKHIHIWGEMSDIDITGFLEEARRHARSILVGDVMSTEVVSVTPDTHLLLIVDIMVRKHVRRIPVVEGGKVLGLVHISDLFYYCMQP